MGVTMMAVVVVVRVAVVVTAASSSNNETGDVHGRARGAGFRNKRW